MADTDLIPLPPRTKDRTGERVGKLTVIRYVGRSPSGGKLWFCQCDCGGTVTALGNNLCRKHTESCGCHRLARISATKTTHGRRGAAEYAVWNGIKARCTNPSQQNYERYGGAGITMCERWANSFEDFYSDMGPRPTPQHTIDRIKNHKGYEPGNCRWATKREQAQNTRKATTLTFNGVTLPTPEWARRFGIRLQTLHGRLKHGWSVESALTTPVALRV